MDTLTFSMINNQKNRKLIKGREEISKIKFHSSHFEKVIESIILFNLYSFFNGHFNLCLHGIKAFTTRKFQVVGVYYLASGARGLLCTSTGLTRRNWNLSTYVPVSHVGSQLALLSRLSGRFLCIPRYQGASLRHIPFFYLHPPPHLPSPIFRNTKANTTWKRVCKYVLAHPFTYVLFTLRSWLALEYRI